MKTDAADYLALHAAVAELRKRRDEGDLSAEAIERLFTCADAIHQQRIANALDQQKRPVDWRENRTNL